MVPRLLGRLVTGPLAFLVAWVIDAGVLLWRLVVKREGGG
jgi:sorbitol-specific phosphotransferase system component IIBC